ncbi:hypothetical protein Taro_037020 [Colocasia esculenta]|uniref:Uncharacterized protein n=1 Tax=Colocasia esculenta TaxID=4460 RepID=A0A843W321_COLES|nr:hypothetical protein [Colocasia esculenta]
MCPHSPPISAGTSDMLLARCLYSPKIWHGCSYTSAVTLVGLTRVKLGVGRILWDKVLHWDWVPVTKGWRTVLRKQGKWSMPHLEGKLWMVNWVWEFEFGLGKQWYKPDWWKFGDEKMYFRHAAGSLFILSKNLAWYINVNRTSLSVAPFQQRTPPDLQLPQRGQAEAPI